MIHKEGYRPLLILIIILLALNLLVWVLELPVWVTGSVLLVSILLLVFFFRFFRNPQRLPAGDENVVYAPADGKVVVVEETEEGEYFRDRRIQVSIFMSVWNVHINWFPVSGTVKMTKYHPGKYLIARHPKSSTLNERNTCVIRTESGKDILIRQIAGAVARRIISYPVEKDKVSSGDELGFIRFGSRVDLFLPPDSQILVSWGQKAIGSKTPVAHI